jgi:Holliday junction resolvasome RuvABC endonuclease subunit
VKGILVSGADPGFAHLGLGTLLRDNRGWGYVSSALIETKPRDGDYLDRMRVLGKAVSTLEGALFVYEDQEAVLSAMHHIGHRNSKSDRVRDVVGLYIGRAVALDAEIIPVTPLQIRSGLNLPANATKLDMFRVVKQIVKDLPDGLSLHVADALAAIVIGERMWRAQTELARAKR